MKPIVEVNGVYKQYRSGERVEYLSLRESISDFFTKSKTEKKNLFYALEDINFHINPGESVGIMGKNGAGKSTLLKIMSRVTYPTQGSIIMRARVASLLEVGTGFHSELTGRENIYFNGNILGLKKHEITRMFDSIVDFSGVEQFLDTPLKRYSSGMAVRLGFAVAAHLEPEVMIIDEVLAVGDVEFQKKCIMKMNDVVRDGRTVIFVSHSMQMLEKLCKRGIYLNNGKLIADDSINTVTNIYLNEHGGKNENNYFEEYEKRLGRKFTFCRAEILDLNLVLINEVKSGQEITLRVHYIVEDPTIKDFSFNVIISDNRMKDLINLSTESLSEFTIPTTSKAYFDIKIPELPLIPGLYYLSFYAKKDNTHFEFLERAMEMEVTYSDYYGSGLLPNDGILLKYEIQV